MSNEIPELGPLTPTPEYLLRQATATVLRNAQGTEDCLTLLDMLGLA